MTKQGYPLGKSFSSNEPGYNARQGEGTNWPIRFGQLQDTSNCSWSSWPKKGFHSPHFSHSSGAPSMSEFSAISVSCTHSTQVHQGNVTKIREGICGICMIFSPTNNYMKEGSLFFYFLSFVFFWVTAFDENQLLSVLDFQGIIW